MKQIPWFSKTFDFGKSETSFSPLRDQLVQFPEKLNGLLKPVPIDIHGLSTDGKWSVKENIGHLLVMEEVWLKRMQQLASGASEMYVADLTNAATSNGMFNTYATETLLGEFREARNYTIQFLSGTNVENFRHQLLHPRLQQFMNLYDLMHFVVLHDEHHLQTIRSLVDYYTH